MKIYFVDGVRAGDEIEFSLPEITIGREDGNLLRIPVPGVSRYHARLWRNPIGTWIISDQGSTNGVKLNGKKIHEDSELSEGDELEIGRQTMRLSALSDEMPKVIFNPLPTSAAVLPGGLFEEQLKPQTAPGVGRVVTDEEKSDTSAKDADKTVGNMPDEFIKTLKVASSNLFNGGNGTSTETDKTSAPGHPTSARRLSLPTLIVLIVCLVVIAVTACLKWLPDAGAKNSRTAQIPIDAFLTIRYEKEIIKSDNIFRFVMLLEGDNVQFTIDDIQSQRHFQRKEKIDTASLGILRSRIRKSGLWKMDQPEPARSKELIRRRLLVCEAPNLIDIRVDGEFAPCEFEDVEAAISVLAESYDLQTISLTSEELLRQAENSYNKAEELYANREARLENLRNAITRYQQVVNYLGQFSPPPQMWDSARKRIAEAEALRKHKLENLEFERVRLGQIKDYAGMRQIFLQIMELTDPASREYDIARQRLFKLDSLLRRNQ